MTDRQPFRSSSITGRVRVGLEPLKLRRGRASGVSSQSGQPLSTPVWHGCQCFGPSEVVTHRKVEIFGLQGIAVVGCTVDLSGAC